MDPVLAVPLVISLLFVLLLAEVPAAWSLALCGTLGVVLVRGWGPALAMLASLPYQGIASYTLTVVPLFILMGMLAKHSGIAEDIYYLANRYLRRLPGGLGIASIVASAGFGAVSGSSVASVATVGRIAIDEMRRYGYDDRLAAGIVASSGTLAVLIPPSVILVLYGALAGESIGSLLLAGIIPGIFSGLAYCAYVGLRVRREERRLASARPSLSGPSGTEDPLRKGAVLGLLKVALLFIVVVGGIYSGILTATESAGVGALGAFLMLFIRRPVADRTILGDLAASLREAAEITSMVFAIYFGATVFTQFFVSAGVPGAFTRTVLGLGWEPWMIATVIFLGTIPLGMFLDGLSILVIVVPLAHPVVVGEFGFSGIWFGIMMVKFIEFGLITPPVGFNAYVVAGLSEDLTVERVFRGLVPFGAIDMLTIAVLFAFPVITTFLPEMRP